MEEKRYWIWLSMIPNLGSKRKQKLLEIYKTPKEIYNRTKEELINIEGIGEKIVKNILDSKMKKQIDNQINRMEDENVDIITIFDENYPQILKNIYDPPICLFVKGNIENLNRKNISIIGCRDASKYGESTAKYFGYQLSKCGINIVSGLAKGVDSYSHIGNICAKKEENNLTVDKLSTVGSPIAVIGSGLDIVYPKENEILVKQILNVGGTIISEYPLGTKPDKMNFPARNRIISGLSEGVLVVEAKNKSGTLLTVDFALEQGREVFTIPR